MSSIDPAKSSCVAVIASDFVNVLGASARVKKTFRSFAAVLAAASLAACAQSPVVRHSASVGPNQQASWHDLTSSFIPDRHVATARAHAPFAPPHNTPPTQTASQGIASFYTEGQRTASGEKFNTHDLTAAHPTLPFGTRLRVTNVATGRSVTVRVNDRGPYVAGRVVDVSYSAANALGMVGSGTAKVKLDVVP